MLFSSGSEQKSITHILYRFSVFSSIYICVVSMNLYYILCKYIVQYNMLIHSIFHIRNLRILISTEGTFHFVVHRKNGITGVFRSETPSLYSLTWNMGLFSCFHISSTGGNTPILLYFQHRLSETILHRKGWHSASLPELYRLYFSENFLYCLTNNYDVIII